jgi:hypothetical protein
MFRTDRGRALGTFCAAAPASARLIRIELLSARQSGREHSDNQDGHFGGRGERMIVALQVLKLHYQRARRVRAAPQHSSSAQTACGRINVRATPLALNQSPCGALSRRALMPKKVATGRQPPNNGPLATSRAPSPMAIADEPPPSSSMPSRAPNLASRSSTRRGDAHSATARNNNLRSASIPMAVRESGCRSLPDHILPSSSQTACPPIPHFAWRNSAGLGGLDGRRCGFKSSSNHNRYVCSQKWLVTWSETTVSTPFARSPGSRGRQAGFEVNNVPLMATARRSSPTTLSIQRNRY